MATEEPDVPGLKRLSELEKMKPSPAIKAGKVDDKSGKDSEVTLHLSLAHIFKPR